MGKYVSFFDVIALSDGEMRAQKETESSRCDGEQTVTQAARRFSYVNKQRRIAKKPLIWEVKLYIILLGQFAEQNLNKMSLNLAVERILFRSNSIKKKLRYKAV
jgi:hypothetical protein